jgi:hypothetical protein
VHSASWPPSSPAGGSGAGRRRPTASSTPRPVPAHRPARPRLATPARGPCWRPSVRSPPVAPCPGAAPMTPRATTTPAAPAGPAWHPQVAPTMPGAGARYRASRSSRCASPATRWPHRPGRTAPVLWRRSSRRPSCSSRPTPPWCCRRRLMPSAPPWPWHSASCPRPSTCSAAPATTASAARRCNTTTASAWGGWRCAAVGGRRPRRRSTRSAAPSWPPARC